MKKKIRYMCEICEAEFDHISKVRACERRGFKPCFKVGDIVTCKAGFCWFDGKEAWVLNPGVKKNPEHGNCFGECCTMAFYYVITKIDQGHDDPHRPRYHLFTDAMTGKQGHKHGYTYDAHHYTLKIVKDPPELVLRDSKKLIGRNAYQLI